jgi:hypothetical protein
VVQHLVSLFVQAVRVAWTELTYVPSLLGVYTKIMRNAPGELTLNPVSGYNPAETSRLYALL